MFGVQSCGIPLGISVTGPPGAAIGCVLLLIRYLSCPRSFTIELFQIYKSKNLFNLRLIIMNIIGLSTI